MECIWLHHKSEVERIQRIKCEDFQEKEEEGFHENHDRVLCPVKLQTTCFQFGEAVGK
jgi:hypothetical protein